MRGAAPALALAVALVAARPAAADDPDLQFDPVRDGFITGAAGLLWLGSKIWVAELAPGACRWCDRDGDRDRTPAIDRAARRLRWTEPRDADAISDITAYFIAPASALGLPIALAMAERRSAAALGDAAIVLEAAFLAADLTLVAKLAAGRERPFVHALPAAERSGTDRPVENNLSFYSGHTSLAFSLAVASGTVASARGYRHAWLVWTAGLAAASATGYLRIAADKHYATDVLMGAAIGSLVGVAVPTWVARRRGPRRDVVVASGARSVALRVEF